MTKSKSIYDNRQSRIILVQNLLHQIFVGSKYSHENTPLNLLRPFMNVMMLLFQSRMIVSTVEWEPKSNEYKIVTCSVVDYTLGYIFKIKTEVENISPDDEDTYLIRIKNVDDDKKDEKRKYFFVLHKLPSEYNKEPEIIESGKPDFTLLQKFLDALNPNSDLDRNVIKWMNCVLDAWRSPDGKFFKTRNRGKRITENENIKIDPDTIAQLIGHVSQVLDGLYEGARDLSLLNKDVNNPRPNIFFALKTAGREIPRFNRGPEDALYKFRGYPYDIRIIIPETQKKDWCSFEDGVDANGKIRNLISNDDINLIRKKFVNERSVLDEPLSSGILTLPQIGKDNSNFQNPNPEMSRDEKKQKEERHKITTKIFKHIIDIKPDDTETEIRLNAYPIHFFGSPYLVVGTFTEVKNKKFDVDSWTRNFHYYSEYIRVAFSRKFRSRLRRKLLDVIYGKTESTFDLLDAEDETSKAMSKVIEMNNFFFQMALVFPIPRFKISSAIPIKFRSLERQWGDGKIETYLGVDLYLTAERNAYFIKNMKRPQKNYFKQVVEQITRGIQDRRQEYADAHVFGGISIHGSKFFEKVPEVANELKKRRVIIFDTENDKNEPDNRLSLRFLTAYIQAIHVNIYDGCYPIDSYHFAEDIEGIKDNHRRLYKLAPNLGYIDVNVVSLHSHQEVGGNTKIEENKGAYIIFLPKGVSNEVYKVIAEIIAREEKQNYILCGPSCSSKINLGIKGIRLSALIDNYNK